MSVETISSLKEQLYAKASFDFSGSAISAAALGTEYSEEEIAADAVSNCKGTAGTFGSAGSVCGCAGTFGSLGTYGCGS
jgi:hypothetical protein